MLVMKVPDDHANDEEWKIDEDVIHCLVDKPKAVQSVKHIKTDHNKTNVLNSIRHY